MDLSKVVCDAGDWIELAQDRGPMAGLCKDGNESSGSYIFVYLRF